MNAETQLMPTDWGYEIYQDCIEDGLTHQEAMKIVKMDMEFINSPEYQEMAKEMKK